MAFDKKMLALAATVAAQYGDNSHRRMFRLGAVGLRCDNVIVKSSNIVTEIPEIQCHAEARLSKKLTPRSTVWVARVRRDNGEWNIARPCPSCELILKSVGVERVVYTISSNEWGVLDLRRAT